MKNYPHIRAALNAVPWAIEPRALDMLCSIVGRHEAGEAVQAAANSHPAPPQAKGIAVIPIHGPIVPRASLMSAMSGASDSASLRAMVNAAADDALVDTIALHIDSPGGAVIGGFEVADAIFEARSKKPVMAIVDGIGASMAYLFASQASEIIATRGSYLGSVGVIARYYDTDRAEKNEGVDAEVVASSPRKAMSGMTHAQIRDKMQKEVDAMFEQMSATINRARAGLIESADSFPDMLGAEAALAAGLIDHIGTFDDFLGTLKNSG